MFKFQAFKRLATYALLSVYVLSIPLSANAMMPGGGKGPGGSGGSFGGGNADHLILAAQAFLLALQAGPGLLNQAALAAPDLFAQLGQILQPAAQPAPVQAPVTATPIRAQAPRPVMPTPQGHSRVVQGENFFGTPRTLGSRGIYIHTQEQVAFEPIDVQGQPITEDEAFQLLNEHQDREALLALLPPAPPSFTLDGRERCEKYRYAGKTKNPMKERFEREVKDARKKDDRPSRHFQGLRGGFLHFGRAIFINTRPEDNLDIERALIRFTQANWGLGLNSNGGSKSKKRALDSDDTALDEDEDEFSFLTEDCHQPKYRRFQEDPDDGDSDGSSSDSTNFSPSGSQNLGLAEVY